MSENEFDIIIIGSGMGGLVSAYILSKEGYSVCLLEKNQQFGGGLQDFKFDGVTFDTGVHYVGGLDEGQVLHKYFTYLNIIDKLKYKRLDENGFEHISFDGIPKSYKYGIGKEKFTSILSEDFPSQHEQIKDFVNTIHKVGLSYPYYHLSSENYKEITTFDYLDTSIYQYLDKKFSDPILQSVLGGNNLLYAGNKEYSTLYEHALITNSYIDSAYRFIGGAGQVAKQLVRNIRANGGVVKRHHQVKTIQAKQKTAQYVVLQTGEKYFAKQFISNIHPSLTLDMIQGTDIRKSYVNRIHQIKNSSSAFTLHITLKKNQVAYQNYNHYHFKDLNVWDGEYYTQENWPRNFMAFTPINKSDKWADSVIAIAYMNFEDVKEWASTKNTVGFEEDRGEKYTEFKQKKTAIFLKEIYKVMPQLKGNIKNINVSTPLTYRDYLYTPKGSIYGCAKDYSHPLHSYISPRSKLSNLFFTGQNVNMHGVLGVSISAFSTCGEILGKEYLYQKVKF